MGDFQVPLVSSVPKPVVVTPPPSNAVNLSEKPRTPETLEEMMEEEAPEIIEETIDEEEQVEEVETEDVDQITEIVIATEYETEEQQITTNQDEESQDEHDYSVSQIVEPTVVR